MKRSEDKKVILSQILSLFRMASITPVLWIHKPLADGRFSIRIRIEALGRTLYKSTGFKARETEWHPKRLRVRGKSPEVKAVNSGIDRLMKAASDAEIDLIRENEIVTAEAIRDRLAPRRRGPKTDLFDVGDKRVAELNANQQVYTATRYESILKQLREYERGRPLPLDRITPAYLRAYETHLISKQSNGASTVASKMRALKALMGIAARDGLISRDVNPFEGVAIREPKSTKHKLTWGQVQALSEVTLERPQLRLARDSFLFSFYAAGIRFGDLCRLGPQNLRNGRLEWEMGKVSRGHGVALAPAAREILACYAGSGESGFLFPFLHRSDTSTPAKERAVIGARNAAVNRSLKEVGGLAGIKVRLTFHMSRHSFADYARREGVDIYTISKLLGHTDIAITQRYLSSFDERAVDAAIGRLFG
ncbi:MAG: site-specific integrase [Rhodothermales bacterium]|nr:site-specific integrase [Rhodothermales bacterium]